MDARPLLTVQNLSVWFDAPGGPFRAVDGVSFSLAEGQTLALVGESGCGKTLTAMALLRLLPAQARLGATSICLRGRELTHYTESEYRNVRGKAIAMLFQEPMSALNPVISVGEQIAEGCRLHERLGRALPGSGRSKDWQRSASRTRAAVPAPIRTSSAAACASAYSWPLRWRAGLLSLIADEPTSALDLRTAAEILQQLRRLQQTQRFALLLITHDFAVVAEMAQEVAVMYAGQLIEQTTVKEFFARPLHPYTRGLVGSVPRLDLPHNEGTRVRLATLEGTPPDPYQIPPGCHFAPRCPHALAPCQQSQVWRQLSPHHGIRCCRAEEIAP